MVQSIQFIIFMIIETFHGAFLAFIMIFVLSPKQMTTPQQYSMFLRKQPLRSKLLIFKGYVLFKSGYLNQIVASQSSRLAFGRSHIIFPFKYGMKASLFANSFAIIRGFKLVSPSKFIVSTNMISSFAPISKMSAGNYWSFSILTMSPGFNCFHLMASNFLVYWLRI